MLLFMRGTGHSRSLAESFHARGAPSRSPAEPFHARGAPSRSPAEGSHEHAHGGKSGAIFAALGEMCGLGGIGRRAVCIGLIACVGGCTEAPPVRVHGAEAYPSRLSAWGVLQRHGDRLVLGKNVVAYDINTPLFSDYALKLRTVWLPAGTSAAFDEWQSYAMPVGTIISKTFFYPLDSQSNSAAASGWDGDIGKLDLTRTKLIETRLLVKQESGWDALPYVWRGDDAWLTITGDLQNFPLQIGARRVALDYIVPTRNDCIACHATGHAGAMRTIGIKTRHLNRGYHGAAANQLAVWQQRGLLRGLPPASHRARNADWRDGNETVEHRARSYLDANCGHCHNPDSAMDTSGLWLDYQDHPPRRMGLCKPPIAAGRGTGGRPWSITPGKPDASILTFRLAATDPAMRMPEIGRTLVHTEAVAVVRQWIGSLGGECLPAQPPESQGTIARNTNPPKPPTT